MIHEELDRELEVRLRATLDEMIPKLVASAPSIDHPLASSTAQVDVEVWSVNRPKRSHFRPLVVAMAAAAAVTGFAIIINRPAQDGPASSDSVPVATGEPAWFSLLRPLVPDRFGFLAITNSTEDSATFVAIGAEDGKALEIALAPTDQYSDPAGTTDQVGSWTETPQGWVVNTPAGLRVEVSCDIGAKGRDFPGPPNYCDMASTGAFTKTEIRSIASAIANATVIEAARDPGLVTPAPQDQLLDLMAIALPNQQSISDTTWGPGDHVWDFAAIGQSRPDTSVRIIAGVYPRPTNRLGPVGGLYGDAAALWVVDPSGVAVRISTTDPRPDSYFAMQALATGIADRVAGQSSTAANTTATSSTNSLPATALTQYYAAVEGDSASSVAALFDVTTVELVEFNGWADGSSHPLVAGDTVRVPAGARMIDDAVGSLGEIVLTDGTTVSVGLTGDQSGICLLTPEAIGGCDGTPATLSPVYVVASGQDENQHQFVYGVVDDGLVVTLLTPTGEIPVTTSEASEGRRGFAILNIHGAGVTLIVRDGAANEISRTPVGA
jgi:hypothetical protein